MNPEDLEIGIEHYTDAEKFELEVRRQVDTLLRNPNHIYNNDFSKLENNTGRIAAEIGVLGTLWAHFAWLEEINSNKLDIIEAEEYLKHKKNESKDATETFLKRLVVNEKRYQLQKNELALITIS